MQVQAAGRLDTVQLNEPLRHHDQVGEHVVVAEKPAHRVDCVGYPRGRVASDKFLERGFCVL